MATALELKVRKIAAYLLRKYDTSVLSQYQVCKELLFRGKELGAVLGTSKLPTTKVKDVATYIVLHT